MESQKEQDGNPDLAGDVDEFGRPEEVTRWRKLEFATLSDGQRAACHELLRRGQIDFILHPEQRRLLQWVDENPNDFLAICIPRQFGKSFMLLAYCVAHCIRNPGHQVLFVAPLQTQVKEIVGGRLSHVLSYLPDDCVPAKNNNTWVFPNGSVFAISGVNIGGGTKLRGTYTPNLVVMDEVRDVGDLQDIIESAIIPMLTTTAGKVILISTPPESPLHSFTSKYIREAQEVGGFYTCTYKSNALLSTKMLKRLISTTYKGGEENPTFRREYMADYSITDPEKRVVREWDEKANDAWFADYRGPVDDAKRPITIRPHTFMDYGHNDPCGLLFGYYDWWQGCMVVTHEYLKRAMNTDDVGKKIIEMEYEAFGPLARTGDTRRIMDIDPTMMSDLRSRHGLKFEPCPKIPNDAQMLNRLRVSMLEGRIRVHPRCTQLRFQLKAGVFNAKGSDYVRTDQGGHLDLIDALKYGNLAIRWNEILRDGAVSGLAKGQIVVGTNPFAGSGGFGQAVMRRPI